MPALRDAFLIFLCPISRSCTSGRRHTRSRSVSIESVSRFAAVATLRCEVSSFARRRRFPRTSPREEGIGSSSTTRSCGEREGIRAVSAVRAQLELRAGVPPDSGSRHQGDFGGRLPLTSDPDNTGAKDVVCASEVSLQYRSHTPSASLRAQNSPPGAQGRSAISPRPVVVSSQFPDR
jgi:hypothetical protein